jgi:hypothetical protein
MRGKLGCKWVFLTVALLACAALTAVGVRGAGARAPDSPREKLSYAMGVAIARSFHRQQADLDMDTLAQGMRDQLSGEPLRLSDAALREAVSSFQSGLKQKQAQELLAREFSRKRAQERRAAAQATALAEEAP